MVKKIKWVLVPVSQGLRCQQCEVPASWVLVDDTDENFTFVVRVACVRHGARTEHPMIERLVNRRNR